MNIERPDQVQWWVFYLLYPTFNSSKNPAKGNRGNSHIEQTRLNLVGRLNVYGCSIFVRDYQVPWQFFSIVSWDFKVAKSWEVRALMTRNESTPVEGIQSKCTVVRDKWTVNRNCTWPLACAPSALIQILSDFSEAHRIAHTLRSIFILHVHIMIRKFNIIKFRAKIEGVQLASNSLIKRSSRTPWSSRRRETMQAHVKKIRCQRKKSQKSQKNSNASAPTFDAKSLQISFRYSCLTVDQLQMYHTYKVFLRRIDE
jgi:hypothetical protein